MHSTAQHSTTSFSPFSAAANSVFAGLNSCTLVHMFNGLLLSDILQILVIRSGETRSIFAVRHLGEERSEFAKVVEEHFFSKALARFEVTCKDNMSSLYPLIMRKDFARAKVCKMKPMVESVTEFYIAVTRTMNTSRDF